MAADPAGGSDFVTAEIDPGQYRPQASRMMSRGLAVIGVLIAVCVVVAGTLIYLKRAELEDQLERRLAILSQGRAEVIGAWLAGTARPADRVVESELFRLFAAEMDIIAGSLPGAAPSPDPNASDLQATLSEQLPYMERVLSDFARNVGFVEGHVINREGIAFISTAGALEMSAGQQATARALFENSVIVYGPARRLPAGVVVDFYLPIFAAQSEGSGGQYAVESAAPGAPGTPPLAPTVGVLLLTAPIAEMLDEILAPPPLADPGERLVLVQRDGDGGLAWVDPGASPPIRPLVGLAAPAAGEPLPFAQRASVGGDAPAHSFGSPVAGTSWLVVQEIDVAAAEAMARGYIVAVLVVAGLVVVAVIAAFGAFWWRLNNEHSSALAGQFRRLAGRIEAQRRFLDSVNGSIVEYIGVKSRQGQYRYLNPAFAAAIGRGTDEAVGLDDAAIFGAGTAGRLAQSDRKVLDDGARVTFETEIWLDQRLHHLQVSKAPHLDDSGEVAGIVSVMRDVTELVEEQRRRERGMQQMVTSLVRAVELRDPYLAGHSRRLAGFARAVAEELHAGAVVVATVEIAANLSQIGKLAVPVEILTKPGRLDSDEVARLQGHVQHTAAILRDIDFDLPVLEAVTQMQERLDGGGYPAGLAGEQIALPARILGACDVFCARVEPRAYRGGIAPEEALAILEQNATRYDAAVVAALRRVVNSVAGEKLLADLAAGR
jgi:PAS domain S-box-containing protein